MHNRSALRGILAFTLCFVVVALYYATHKPFTPELAVALALLSWRMLVAVAILTLAGALGLRLWHGEGHAPLVRLALQAGLGLGIFSLVILIIGSTLGLPSWLWWLLPPVLGLLLRRALIEWLKQWRELVNLWRQNSAFGRVLGGISAVLFLVALSTTLAPPLQFDSLTYHFTLPHAYLEAGKIRFLPWHVMSGMPQNVEMLHTWAIALGGNEAAAALVWLIGLVACTGLLGYLHQRWDARAAWVGLAALLAGFTPAKLLTGGYVDWAIFLWGLGGLILLDEWRTSGSPRSLWLAGIFTGFAIGSKYTAGVLALAGAAALAWHCWQRRAAFIPALLRFGAAATLTALPWFVKNIITTGNPVFPFFFPSPQMSAVRLSVYQSLPPWGDWMDIVFLPLRATLLGLDSGDGYMFSAGGLLLGLGLLALLPNPALNEGQRASRQNAGMLAIAGLVTWALGNQFSGNLIQTRYYFSIFPAFAVLAAAGEFALRQIQIPKVRLERIATALVLLALSLNLLEVASTALKQGAPQAALGIKSQEAYLADNLGWFQPAMAAVRDLPAGSRTLLLYEPRSLYCAPRCSPDEIMDRWKRTRTLQSVDAITRAWQSEGFTHLLVYQAGIEWLVQANDPHHPPEDLESLTQFLAALPAPVYFGGVYRLYSLPR